MISYVSAVCVCDAFCDALVNKHFSFKHGKIGSSANDTVNFFPYLLPDSINDFRGIQDWVLQSADPPSAGEFALESQKEEFR